MDVWHVLTLGKQAFLKVSFHALHYFDYLLSNQRYVLLTGFNKRCGGHLGFDYVS